MSQLIIEVVYEHFNADSAAARFFASNNIALSARLRFHRARSADGDAGLKIDRQFYLKLLRAPLTQGPKARAAHLTAVLLWAQLANAAGYFYEKYKSRQER